MHNKVIYTTAALALLAGTNFALAQSVGGGAGGGASQSQSGSSTHQRSGGGAGQAGSGMQERSDGNTGQGSERGGRDPISANENNRGQGGATPPGQRTNQDRNREMNQDRNRGQGQNRDSQRSGQSDRNGQKGRNENTGAAPSVNITMEQRTKFREHRSAFASGRVDRVNFNITVGTVVPRSVTLHVLPPEIVTIVPEYRGYRYVMVRDEILIIDPRTLRIVAVINV
ncbi:MAG: DUF1236 domain-containing protein [Variibacter sp.]|nr:DUF1236 domain-containing protein [Variibacter sp.]